MVSHLNRVPASVVLCKKGDSCWQMLYASSKVLCTEHMVLYIYCRCLVSTHHNELCFIPRPLLVRRFAENRVLFRSRTVTAWECRRLNCSDDIGDQNGVNWRLPIAIPYDRSSLAHDTGNVGRLFEAACWRGPWSWTSFGAVISGSVLVFFAEAR